MTPLYFTTVGHYAYKGAALVMLWATGVYPTGRISVSCPGLYNDAQQNGLKQVADFVHAQGGLIGVQLSHAGRKSSTQAPWVALRAGKSSARADIIHGGWPKDFVGPSGGQDLAWDGKIQQEVNFAEAAKRAVTAGADVIEVHSSHGYLFHQFMSPLTNHRTDEYGGSFENRTRIVVETIQAIRATIPDTMPLFVRISTTDWMEGTEMAAQSGSWDFESTIRFAKLLPDLGVDVLDVSSGGNQHQAVHTLFDAGQEHARFAATIRKELRLSGQNLLIGTVGEITNSKQARDLLQDNDGSAPADIISVGRNFLRDPGWVLRVASDSGVDAAWPTQIARPQVINEKTRAMI